MIGSPSLGRLPAVPMCFGPLSQSLSSATNESMCAVPPSSPRLEATKLPDPEQGAATHTPFGAVRRRTNAFNVARWIAQFANDHGAVSVVIPSAGITRRGVMVKGSIPGGGVSLPSTDHSWRLRRATTWKTKNRRDWTPLRIQPRRLTLQRPPRKHRVALYSVIRRFRPESHLEPDQLSCRLHLPRKLYHTVQGTPENSRIIIGNARPFSVNCPEVEDLCPVTMQSLLPWRASQREDGLVRGGDENARRNRSRHLRRPQPV